jgi:protein-tyrosine phosphatase
MIDLHAHILPEVDDGPEELEESLDMIRAAIRDGIDTICATPHLLEKPTQPHIELFEECFSRLVERVAEEQLPVRLTLGAEVYFQPDMERMLDYPALTINGTGRYLLCEFPMQGIPPGADRALFGLVMNGMIPILAHPERNFSVLRDEAVVEPLLHSGALQQVNAGSLEGHFGRKVKKCALSLLKKGMVHFIGSDAHSVFDRPVRLSPAVDVAAAVVGPQMARALVDDHPRCVLMGQPLPEPALSVPRNGTESRSESRLGKIWRGFTGK